MKRPISLLGRFLVWRVKHISNKNFILILSIFVGIIGGIAAAIIKNIIHYSHVLLTHGFHDEYENYLYFIYPIIGIILTVIMVRVFYRKEFAHGITNVLNAISTKNSIVQLKEMFFFIFGSFATVGLGGSVGMEATLVMSGSGIGSNMARLLQLPYRSRKLLLGCGSAAALAAFFNAPIAGVIFALEVLMLDLTMASLVPLLMASVIGNIIATFLLGESIVFNFTLTEYFSVRDLPYYLGLGVFCGFMALYFVRIDSFVSKIYQKVNNVYVKTVAGALIVGLLVFLFPPLYGEGYSAIKSLISNDSVSLMNNTFFFDFKDTEFVFILFLAAIILAKAFAVSITLNSGGIGGFFAPSLFIGGLSGFLFARTQNYFDLTIPLSETNFTLVGMAGAMSGIFHAPLTAIFLIAEITKGYELIVPLMLVSTISYLIGIYFEPHSIFTRRLAQKGELITHHKDKEVLTLLKLRKIVERDLITVSPGDSLEDLLRNAVSKSNRNIFPVVDVEGKLSGMVLLNDIRSIMFKPELYDTVSVEELMIIPPTCVMVDEPMEKVIRKFDETGAWNLPVIDSEEKYVGFISKSKIFSAYRRLLVQFSDE